MLPLSFPLVGALLSCTSSLSRSDFLWYLSSSDLLLNRLRPSPSSEVVPLRFLPTAGCLAVPVTLEESYRYFAIVDTGSPFLTAPSEVIALTRGSSRRYPSTYEQYGETSALVSWRRSDTMISALDIPHCLLGVVPDDLRDETGGLFLGLMWQDELLPSLLQQAQYSSFCVDYASRTLELHTMPQLSASDGTVLECFDLTSYGPNLHHYAILVQELSVSTRNGDYTIQDCTRPIVVVIDTGLTGCIFSDSLQECLPVPLSSLCGARINVGPVSLASNATYWNLSSFRLPWFSDGRNHPHIVAAGATFLQGSKIVVDAKERRIKLENTQS